MPTLAVSRGWVGWILRDPSGAGMTTVAALYVDARGCYAGLPDVEVWDEARDARLYDGPHPVVAHPPCARWCRLAGLVEARWGHRRGDDGGTFAAALESVRRWGGVLEHPAYSDAWDAFDLPVPPRVGWIRGLCGGWSCHVEQGRYGHPARKATWLYAHGVTPPTLRWGQAWTGGALVSWCGNRVRSGERRPRVGRSRAAATPPAFRDALLAIARTACPDPCGPVREITAETDAAQSRTHPGQRNPAK